MAKPSPETESILLVDDEPTNLQILIDTIKEIGCKMLVAKDGETALAISRKALPDLILLDIMMPGIDGYEVCRQLKADPATADIPVIFLSALTDTADKVKGFQTGAVDFVTKPFQTEEVIARVNTHLTIHRLGREVQDQKNKLERELKIVSALQKQLLPDTCPEIEGISLGVHYETSLYSGGDYYDFILLPNRQWGIFLADAEGHGAPAAVMMAMTCTLFRSYPDTPDDPAAVLSFLNRHLRRAYGSSFVTAIYAVLDPGEKTIRLSRAGHCLPMIFRSAEKKASECDCPGVMPLGIESYEHIPVTHMDLRSGDRLLLYTDGLSERFNPVDRIYGEERLLQQFENVSGLHPNDMIAQMVADVERFAEGRPADDDQAMLLVMKE